MKISQSTFLTIQSILTAFEAVKLVSGSSLSDNDEKLQQSGVTSGSDTGNSSKVPTPTSSFVNNLRFSTVPMSARTFPHHPPTDESSSFANSPYYSEFMSGFMNTPPTFTDLGYKNPFGSGIAEYMTDARMRRTSTEVFGSDSTGKRSESFADSKWVAMISQAASESRHQIIPDNYDFENVNHAAFYDVMSAAGPVVLSADVSSDASGTAAMKRDIPLEQSKAVEAEMPGTENTGAATADLKTENTISEPTVFTSSMPFSYKDALKQNTVNRREISKAIKTSDKDGKTQPTRENRRTSPNKQKASTKQDNAKGSTRNSLAARTDDIRGNTKSSAGSDEKAPREGDQDQEKAGPQALARVDGAGRQGRTLTCPEDILTVLRNAARSGSEASIGTNQQSSQPMRIKSSPQHQVSSEATITKQQPVTPPIRIPHQSPANQQELNSDNAVPLSNWKREFRLPQAFAPPAGIKNAFYFPRIKESNQKFLDQLHEFRESLMIYKQKKLSNWKDFVDYKPEVNVFERSWSTPKASGWSLYTDAPRNKIFSASPARTWIPVRCEALEMEFKFESPVDGHAGRGDGKTTVSIVSDINSHFKYIRKEYHEMEYFLNEYNFLQFAHHPHIPKPYCVEYSPYPSIVMEYVEGQRVHMFLYTFGKWLLEKHPTEAKLRWDEMGKMLARVLAKVLVTIKYIHSLGFIHADLKPENILFNAELGKVTIIDFDHTVSAPYVCAGRGTASIIAPELNELLKGPVHFGIDWWAYGSTAAMMIASGLAGAYENNDDLFDYVPFIYNRDTNEYKMTKIPEIFPPLFRSFLYPFFNPDPSARVFSEARAYSWIKTHPIFNAVSDWSLLENKSLGTFSDTTPMQLGFMSFSRNPIMLQPASSATKIFSSIKNMIVRTFYGVPAPNEEIHSDSEVFQFDE